MCVVFFDEVGLTKSAREPLKALHHYLDHPEVAFVAISNRILDPARMNRAVIMHCGHADKQNLETVAQGIVSDFEQLKPFIKPFCASFEKLMQSPKFTKIFGLRDFYHFLRYTERNLSKVQNLIYDVNTRRAGTQLQWYGKR